ncbi:MAG: ABC transporter permease [Flavobacteriaceae bacterium]|nr:ABC transporter permease [Flavobacteriaceae bacterium]MCY4267804.1 ABC transporter permease [Flavobacteriaceae bacterium]MCY4298663.1 ABC transporter permease [Flavobacteriaceae bacterium]
MFDRDRWVEIFETIRKNKLRTVLSGFTVALGIFIFVILYGLGNGLKNTFQQFFLDDAENVLFVRPGRTSIPYKGYKSGRRIEFVNSDISDIEGQFRYFIEYMTPRIFSSVRATYETESENYSNISVGPDHQYIEKTVMMYGRYINEQDLVTREKYAVIGRLVALDLFGQLDVVGHYIDLNGFAYRVIGVFQDSGGDNVERTIYTPYTTQQLLNKSTDKISMFAVTFRKELGHRGSIIFENKLRQYLKEKKVISPRDPRGVWINNLADSLKRNQQFAGALQTIVSVVGIGTLIAGIIGISNIMVFVVKERTKELGIRKAIGASPRSVITMVLQESILITTFSGYAGLFLGILMLSSVGERLDEYFITNPYINLNTAIFATIVLVVCGGIAGYIPAKRAASIKPIVALRDE